MTFAFQSYDASGRDELAWTLGTGAIVGGNTTKGTATFSGVVPPGLVKPGLQSVDVYASFGGDATQRPSTSAWVSLAFGPLTFAVQPAARTVAPNGTLAFTTTGGVAPVKWSITSDATCVAATPPHCASQHEEHRPEEGEEHRERERQPGERDRGGAAADAGEDHPGEREAERDRPEQQPVHLPNLLLAVAHLAAARHVAPLVCVGSRRARLRIVLRHRAPS